MRDYCDAQAGFWLNSKFWSKFSRKPLSGIEDQNPPPPFQKTSDLGWPKFTPEYPPPKILKTSDLGWPKFTPEYPPPPMINCQRVHVRDFQNTESYYMWRLYQTRITTSFFFCNNDIELRHDMCAGSDIKTLTRNLEAYVCFSVCLFRVRLPLYLCHSVRKTRRITTEPQLIQLQNCLLIVTSIAHSLHNESVQTCRW